MSVTFNHSTVTPVTLPSPARNSQITPNAYQTLARAASGAVRTFKHGPTKYQRRMTFEALSEVESNLLMTFFESLGWSGDVFDFQFTDPRDGVAKEWIGVRLVEQPSVARLSMNINDVTLTIESAADLSFESATNQ